MKKLLFKTILLAAAMGVGTSVWAEDVYTTVYQKTYAEGDNQWAATDVTAWGSATNLEIDASNYFGFAGKTGSASYTISSIEDYAKVKYVAEWKVQSTNGGYGEMYTYLKLGNLYIRVTDSWKNNIIAFSTDGGTTYCGDISTKKTESWVRSGNIVTVTAILNTAENVVESMSVVFDGTTYTASNLSTTTLSGDNNKVVGLQTTSTKSGSSTSQLASLVVSQCEQEVTIADYTINYIYNEEIIKTVGGTISVGSTVYANSPVTISDTRYYAKDGELTSMEITSGTNVLNVEYRRAETFGYTVKAIDGSSNVLDDNLASGSVTEGDGTTVKYPRYVLSGTTLYASGSGQVTYSTTFTPDAANYVKNITYNSGTVSNVVFYTEGETVSGASVATNDARASLGRMGYTGSADTYLDAATLTPGKYVIYLRGQNGNSASRTFNFKVGETNVFTGSIPNGTNTDLYSSEFTVNSNSTLSFACVGSQQSGIDYFYIVKTGELKSISAAGWATYCSPYALDFSDNIENLTDAYIVTGGANGVLTKSSVKGGTVPANTGLLLKGTAGTVTIPVVASSTTDVSSNIMVGVTAATVIDPETGWVLMNDATNGLGFYKNTKAFTVGANTAYIPLSKLPEPSVNARGFFSLFDDETTGVQELKNSRIEELL